MAHALWIVCERSGAWATALRGAAGGWRAPWRETRTARDCLDVLAASPASVVAVELSQPKLDETLGLLATIGELYPRARTLVLADRALADYEWLALELGVAAFVTSPRDLLPLVMLARRRLSSPSADPRGPIERIRQQLPWS